MTIENLLSQIGMGSKQINDRYAEYTAPMQDHHIYYAYEPSPPGHGGGSTSKHGHGGGGLKSNASMSALTLLAFLFFLHILQQCIKDHMTDMSTSPVVVMTAGRDGESDLTKAVKKIDKAGVTKDVQHENEGDEIADEYYRNADQPNNMLRINAAEHKPKLEYKSRYVYENNENKNSFPGFVNAMDKK